jgi:3-deoxy-D-manno-octulosonate 8-phosphate phosphatase (KDO 8-P phosphatase)
MPALIANAADRARTIRLMGFDVDGVLTDGSLFVGEQGEAFKRFNTLDGHGLKMLIDAGVAVVIISGRNSPAVARRATELGIRYVHQGIKNKVACMEALLEQTELQADQFGFMGDDLPDLPVLVRCGFAATTAEAFDPLPQSAHWQATRAAGHGAVRELAEFILRARGAWDGIVAASREPGDHA